MIKRLPKVRAQRHGLFVAGSVSAAMLAGSSAFAQQTAEPSQATAPAPERVIVTGSNIPTAADETAQPVTVVDRAAIQESGAATVSDIIHRLPQIVGNGNFRGEQVNNPNGGESLIALRGLPVTSTLTLVNGKRFALTAGPQIGVEAVNINTIPLGAVDRVEILREGAGPIYGSDAVAGVVNIILRDSFQGAEVNTYYGNTSHKDAGTQEYSVIMGTSTDKFDFVVTADYYKQNSIASRDSPLFKTADFSAHFLPEGGIDQRSSANGPARINVPGLGSVRLNDGLVTGATAADYHVFGSEYTDHFNFNKILNLTLDSERYGFSADGTYKLAGDALKMKLQGFYNHTLTYGDSAPTPLFSNQEAPLVINGVVTPLAAAANNIHNPFVDADGNKVAPNYVYYRFLELGPRFEATNVDTFRFQGGFEGDIDNGKYHYEASYVYAREVDTEHTTNIINKRELYDQLQNTDPTIASFNIFGNPAYNKSTPAQRAALQRIELDTSYNGHYDTTQVTVAGSGRPVHLPGGDLGVAAGFEFRQEELVKTPDSNITSFNTVGSTNQLATVGGRNVYSGYGEMKIPLTGENFHLPGIWGSELDLAFRREQFSDFGSADKPAISAFVQPFDDSLKLRASYSQGFKAPALAELFQGGAESFETISNPNVPDQGQARVLQGGNRNLQAETSRSYDAGFVYSPKFKYLQGLTLRADAFRITKRNNVTLLDAQGLLDSALAGNAFAKNLVIFNPDGTVQTINDTYANLGKNVVEGVDWGMTYELPTKIGKFTGSWDATYLSKFSQSLANSGPGSRTINFAGSTGGYGSGGAGLPRLQGLGTFIYEFGGINFVTNVQYIGTLSERALGVPTGQLNASHYVEDYVKTDVQISYTFGKPGPAMAAPPAPKDGKDAKGSGKDAKEMAAVGPVGKGHWYDDLTLTAGCNNLFDTSPPFESGGFAQGTPTDLNLYDVTGRFIYGRVVKKF